MKLHRYIDHDSQMTPIDFQVTRSKVKVTVPKKTYSHNGCHYNWQPIWGACMFYKQPLFIFILSHFVSHLIFVRLGFLKYILNMTYANAWLNISKSIKKQQVAVEIKKNSILLLFNHVLYIVCFLYVVTCADRLHFSSAEFFISIKLIYNWGILFSVIRTCWPMHGSLIFFLILYYIHLKNGSNSIHAYRNVTGVGSSVWCWHLII